jgi:hypothetical protein
MIVYPITHRELQEAIDKASHFLLESKRLGIAYGTGVTEKHLEQLYKLQIAILGKIESK